MHVHLQNSWVQKKIIAIDIYKDRLSLAKEFGADYVINAKQENNIIKKLKK